jgi:hypothetical protein
MPVEMSFTSGNGTPTRTTMSLDASRTFLGSSDFTGRSPYGALSLKVTGGPTDVLGMLDDVIVIIDYKAKVHYPK